MSGEELYFASPQLSPISISHLEGTHNGTASTMIFDISLASSIPVTDMAISSWIWIIGTRPVL